MEQRRIRAEMRNLWRSEPRNNFELIAESKKGTISSEPSKRSFETAGCERVGLGGRAGREGVRVCDRRVCVRGCGVASVVGVVM